MPKRSPGLYKRWSEAQQRYIWEIDKQVRGERLRISTGTADLEEANKRLAFEVEQLRKRQIYGEAPDKTFMEAVTRYYVEYADKRSINRDRQGLDHFMGDIGHLPLRHVHQGTLQPTIDRRRRRVSAGTINRDLAAVRRVLSLSARLWRDETGEPWLGTLPMIARLEERQKRAPYPLTHDEQALLFKELPDYLECMALFAVHTGMRMREVCNLKWAWLAIVDGHKLFLLPASETKNKTDRIAVCNRIAASVVASQEGKSNTWVFPSPRGGGAMERMNNHGWRAARERAAARYSQEIGGDCPRGFARVRVHDLRHTFGRRLRAAGVSLEDRQDLLGHRGRAITTEYSAAEIHRLAEAANLVCDGTSRPMLRVVG